jgi:hypothetical protein
LLRKALKALPLVALLGVVAATSASSAFGFSHTTSSDKSEIIITSGSDTTQFMETALGDLYTFSPGCNNLASPQPKDGSCQSGGANPAPGDSSNFTHDTIANRFFIGSGGGIAQLCAQNTGASVQEVEIARSSRVPLTAAQGGSDCHGLSFVGYAADGVTWEAFPGLCQTRPSTVVNFSTNTCASGTPSDSKQVFTAHGGNLTQAKLEHIFVDCTYKDWSKVGGTAGAINVYTIQANSGTGVTWAAYLGNPLTSGQVLDNCISPTDPAVGSDGSHKSPENTNSLIFNNDNLASNTTYSPAYDAIMGFSVGVYENTIGPLVPKSGHISNADGSRLGKINSSSPTFAAIQAGTFPDTRLLFNVYCSGSTSPGVGNCGTATPADAHITDFAGPHGFICDDVTTSGGADIKDPQTGQLYRVETHSSSTQPAGEIPATIVAKGFVPLLYGTSGNGYSNNYCQTLPTT